MLTLFIAHVKLHYGSLRTINMAICGEIMHTALIVVYSSLV